MKQNKTQRPKAVNALLHKYTYQELKHICELKRKRREDKLRKRLWYSIRTCPENFGFKFSKKDNQDIFLACSRAYDYMHPPKNGVILPPGASASEVHD